MSILLDNSGHFQFQSISPSLIYTIKAILKEPEIIGRSRYHDDKYVSVLLLASLPPYHVSF